MNNKEKLFLTFNAVRFGYSVWNRQLLYIRDPPLRFSYYSKFINEKKTVGIRAGPSSALNRSS